MNRDLKRSHSAVSLDESDQCDPEGFPVARPISEVQPYLPTPNRDLADDLAYHGRSDGRGGGRGGFRGRGRGRGRGNRRRGRRGGGRRGCLEGGSGSGRGGGRGVGSGPNRIRSVFYSGHRTIRGRFSIYRRSSALRNSLRNTNAMANVIQAHYNVVGRNTERFSNSGRGIYRVRRGVNRRTCRYNNTLSNIGGRTSCSSRRQIFSPNNENSSQLSIILDNTRDTNDHAIESRLTFVEQTKKVNNAMPYPREEDSQSTPLMKNYSQAVKEAPVQKVLTESQCILCEEAVNTNKDSITINERIEASSSSLTGQQTSMTPGYAVQNEINNYIVDDDEKPCTSSSILPNRVNNTNHNKNSNESFPLHIGNTHSDNSLSEMNRDTPNLHMEAVHSVELMLDENVGFEDTFNNLSENEDYSTDMIFPPYLPGGHAMEPFESTFLPVGVASLFATGMRHFEFERLMRRSRARRHRRMISRGIRRRATDYLATGDGIHNDAAFTVHIVPHGETYDGPMGEIIQDEIPPPVLEIMINDDENPRNIDLPNNNAEQLEEGRGNNENEVVLHAVESDTSNDNSQVSEDETSDNGNVSEYTLASSENEDVVSADTSTTQSEESIENAEDFAANIQEIPNNENRHERPIAGNDSCPNSEED